MSLTATETVVAATSTEVVEHDDAAHDDDVLAELLVEEISIDGMCGVY